MWSLVPDADGCGCERPEPVVPATLAAVVDRLGPVLVVAVAGDLGAPVGDLVVTDPAHPSAVLPGSLVVAPGFGDGGAPLAPLLEAARTAGAAGVLVKGEGPAAHLDGDEVPVVVIDRRADWGHVLQLLRTATTIVPDGGSGATLFGLADALASLCGGDVVLLDPDWALLAFSGGQPRDAVRYETILGRRTPAEVVRQLEATGLLPALHRGEVVEVGGEAITGLSHRLGVAARIGEEVLATIWVQQEPDRPRTVADVDLRRAADLAALTLLDHAVAGPRGAAAGDSAFAALTTGKRTERVVAERLGVAVDSGFAMVGMRASSPEEAERTRTARRLVPLLRSYADAYRLPVQVAAGGDAAYLLVACPDAEQRRRLVRVVRDMHERLGGTAPHAALVSSGFADLAEVPSVRQALDDLLAFAARRGLVGVTDIDEVGARWQLEQLREVALAHPQLLSAGISRLADHDRAHGTDLVLTLRAYFECVGNVRSAAERLHLHINSVRYRIKRAQEIAGLDLDDPDQRLLAELHLRVLS